jgi:hypothetical protein
LPYIWGYETRIHIYEFVRWELGEFCAEISTVDFRVVEVCHCDFCVFLFFKFNITESTRTAVLMAARQINAKTPAKLAEHQKQVLSFVVERDVGNKNNSVPPGIEAFAAGSVSHVCGF